MNKGKANKGRNEKRRNTGLITGMTTMVGKQTYEGSVATRAIRRAGKNKNLKGHIFEVMTCDKINAKPANILKGKKAVLTRSPTAIRDDIVIKQGKKVVGRMQLKDTPKAINDTVRKVGKKQYKGTNLIGTKETKAVYEKAVAAKNAKGTHITQKMSTNGISSEQTSAIATKALGKNIAKNGGAIAHQASKTGRKAGTISAVIEAIKSVKQVSEGKKSVGEAAISVSKEAATGVASGTIGDAVATIVTGAVSSTPAAPVAPLAGMAAGAAAGAAAGKAASAGTDKVVRNANKVQLYLERRQKANHKMAKKLKKR